MKALFKVHWHRNTEKRPPFYESSLTSPDPALLEPIGFPPPWENRPWIYGVMVSSANGVVAWKPEEGEPHPVWTILGAGKNPEEQLADKLYILYLYTFGDASVGAQTVRDQPELVLAIREPGKEVKELAGVYEKLHNLRAKRRLSHEPRNIIYSPSGKNLDPKHPILTTPRLQTTVVTTKAGQATMEAAGIKGVHVVAAGETEFTPELLARAHERLFRDYGVRYLDCMGGETILQALHEAGILDEVFVTTTDVVVDTERRKGVKYLMDLKGAELIAEGKISPQSPWTFRRWRFNRR